jgi:hypothetical protein
VSLLRAAGFVGVQAVKLTERPWFVHDRVGLREVKFVAWKPLPGADLATRQVLYKGPFTEATADGGWEFPRGRRVTVPKPGSHYPKAAKSAIMIWLRMLAFHLLEEGRARMELF